MSNQYLYGETAPVTAPVLTAQAVGHNDLVGLSSGNVIRAEDVAWDTDLATTQAAFVALFLGLSAQRKAASVARVPGNSADNRIRVNTQGVFEYDLDTATTLVVGDLVGPAKATGNALVSNKVAKVSTEATAIGRVIEAGTSLTSCKFRVLSKQVPAARQS